MSSITPFVNLSVHLLIPAPISPREMTEIEQFVRRVAGRLIARWLAVIATRGCSRSFWLPVAYHARLTGYGLAYK